MNTKHNKVLLIVRDGWGYSPELEHNIIAQADTPYTDMLMDQYPNTLLHASGEEVGLPEGYFGNSEVGHMTMGAGRVLEQSLLRINHAIDNGSFFENKLLSDAIKNIKKNQKKLHLIGLLQKEGVHASFDHLLALLKYAKDQGLKKDEVYIHIITDGRDAPKQYALGYLRDLEDYLDKSGVGSIASLSGRYYAMDRNENWERTQKYYEMILGKGNIVQDSPGEYLNNHYQDPDFSDEFLEPVMFKSCPAIQDHDSIIFFNFRKDRTRQITQAFVEENFSHFQKHNIDVHFVAMTEYYDGLANVLFPDVVVQEALGEILEKHNKTQLRIAETEKYAHVTFFFDGGVGGNFSGEKKILIPSPDVSTFDMLPEMSAPTITKSLITELKNTSQDFILCNFANADMVGHSGDHRAVKKAVEAVDHALSQIVPVALDSGYSIIITADHGNAEHKHGSFETSHTNNPVQCIVVSEDLKDISLQTGKGLKNIAPSVLQLMDIPLPEVYEKPLW